MNADRAAWAALSDAQLLAQCGIDTYRASGPGGQKRNKTSSAVRLRHEPTGLIVIAEESRSQHENKAKALKRLRQAFYLKRLESVDLARVAQHPEIQACRTAAERLDVGRKDPRYLPAIAVMLDVLEAVEAQVSSAAEYVGVSTGNLIAFFEQDPKVWEQLNIVRQKFRQKPLRPGS